MSPLPSSPPPPTLHIHTHLHTHIHTHISTTTPTHTQRERENHPTSMNSESFRIFCTRSISKSTTLAREEAQIRAETESAIVNMLTTVIGTLSSSGWSKMACLPPRIIPSSVISIVIRNGTAALNLNGKWVMEFWNETTGCWRYD